MGGKERVRRWYTRSQAVLTDGRGRIRDESHRMGQRRNGLMGEKSVDFIWVMLSPGAWRHPGQKSWCEA